MECAGSARKAAGGGGGSLPVSARSAAFTDRAGPAAVPPADCGLPSLLATAAAAGGGGGAEVGEGGVDEEEDEEWVAT